MVETLIVIALLALLVAVGWAAVLLSWQWIAVAGALCMAAGFGFGVPAGVYYHVLLHRALAPRGLLPKGWLWSPLRYHVHLHDAERGRVLFYCYAGGVGFGLIVLGGALALFGLLHAK
jgi:hypothetical protein